MGYFKQEGYNSSDDSFLLLNGGDENTGPAVATLSKGEAMMDVMNMMNFTASAIGNHEFDFGIEWMNYRQSVSNFPLLSCNIFDTGTTNLANFSIPWVIQEHAGVQVGIVGLTTTLTETAAHPKYTQYYDFGDYETALRANVPLMRSAGAEIIIALTHIQPDSLVGLASDVADLDIDVFLGGHSGTPIITEVSGAIIGMAGHYAQQYARIDLEVDTTVIPQGVVASSGILVENVEGAVTPVAEIQQRVDYWVNLTGAEEVITHSSINIYDTYPESGIGNLVADGMMNYFGWIHDFTMTNRGGGIRDYFRAGDITVGDVVSVIPFENTMIEVNVTGTELLDIIADGHGYNCYSGIRYNFSWNPTFHITSALIKTPGGFVPINPVTVYTGLMLDYTWWLWYKDVLPSRNTGVIYRDAVIDYFRTILDDISVLAYDGRIQEDLGVMPEYNRFLFLPMIIPVMIVIIRKKFKTKR